MTLQYLKNRSVPLTLDEFFDHSHRAVKWNDIQKDFYIKCQNIMNGKECYATEALVQRASKETVQIINPGRDETTNCYPNSFGGYGINWFLVKLCDYNGPRD